MRNKRRTAASELTPEQYEAVIAYAAENGRTWKSRLNLDWQTASARVYRGPNDYSAELQQVRNQHGPAWLARFQIP